MRRSPPPLLLLLLLLLLTTLTPTVTTTASAQRRLKWIPLHSTTFFRRSRFLLHPCTPSSLLHPHHNTIFCVPTGGRELWLFCVVLLLGGGAELLLLLLVGLFVIALFHYSFNNHHYYYHCLEFNGPKITQFGGDYCQCNQ